MLTGTPRSIGIGSGLFGFGVACSSCSEQNLLAHSVITLAANHRMVLVVP
jgi:hypothetical protein